MHHEETQMEHVPNFLANVTLPFKTEHQPPFVLQEIVELVTVVGACPINLMVTDPAGNKLGFDPGSGGVVTDIPNAIYIGEGEVPQIIMIANPTPGPYSITATGYDPGGTYSFRVDRIAGTVGKVAVFGGEIGPGEYVTVDVDLPANQPPVADAGTDQSVSVEEDCMARVSLDGTLSSDPDGDELFYAWSILEESIASGPEPEVTLPRGTHLITLTVHDGKGQTASDEVTVTVADTTAPVFSNVPPPIVVEQTLLDGTPVTVPMPTVTDNCEVESLESDAPAVFPLGTTTVTFTATDTSGNEATATTTVTVQDTTPPVFSNVPAPVTREQTSRDGTPVEVPMPTASDICDAAPVVTGDAPDVFPLGTTLITFAATDASGNRATATTTVTIQDTIPPVLSNVPAPVTVEQANRNGTRVILPTPTATDICDAAPDIVSDAPDVFPLGKTVVTFTAIDDSGNQTTGKTTVTVVDTKPPRIRRVLPNPSTLWPPNHKMVPVKVRVSVDDICDAAPACRIISVSSNEPVKGKGGDRYPDWQLTGKLSLKLRAERSPKGRGRVYTIRVRCTDDSGNSSTKSGTVAVPHDKGKKSGNGKKPSGGKSPGKGKKPGKGKN
jgi:hypothetical protein